MDYSIRPMDGSELMYAYPQSAQISAQTGCIGKLTGSIDKDGDALLTNWKDVIPGNKTDGFKADLDAVLGTLRRGNGADAFLKDRLTLFMFCSDRPGSRIDGTHEFAFRLDTNDYSYMMRLDPDKGDTNLTCFCYTKKWLNEHMKHAEKGIRFIDTNYNLKFIIPDGGKITVNFSTGDTSEYRCRYIDDYHAEVGEHLYHICEFAELLERNGHTARAAEKGTALRDVQAR